MSTEPRTPTDDAQDSDDRVVSRRRMIRTVAAATVAGTAGTAAAATPAQAAPGDPILVDDTNAGTGTTALEGSQLKVTRDGEAAAVEANNATGPPLQLNVNIATEFPPTTGLYHEGAIVNWQGQLFQCVDSDGAPNSTTVWARLTNTGPVLTLLPKPIRVYATTADEFWGYAKTVRQQVREVDTTLTPGGLDSGVPSWAVAVVGTVQLYATETNTGYLAIAAGDVHPSGYSTAVWSAPGFSGVTSFTSQLGDPASVYWGMINVSCNSAAAAARTHYFIDIVGYYDHDIFYGGPGDTVADATRLRQEGGRAVRKVRQARTRR